MKRLLSIVLAACLLIGTLPPVCAMGGIVGIPPSSGPCGPNATYEWKDGVLTISGTGVVSSSSAAMPWTQTVIVIEDGITELTWATFRSMSHVTQVQIPDSVTYIGPYAFHGTPWLESQTDEFVIVGDGILLDYNGPGGEVTVPDTVRSIAGNAFEGSDITSITIGNSVEEISWYAFSDCDKLVSVSIADSVSYIEGEVFTGTPWLESQTDEFVVVGDGVLIAYKGSGGVVVIPDTVHSIAEHAFSSLQDAYVSPIVEITIPNTVVDIPYSFSSLGGNGDEGIPPVIVHGAAGSEAERFCLQNSVPYYAFRFIPFGQEDGSLFNFVGTRSYYPEFSDVSEDDWFHIPVKTVYQMTLMNGKSSNTFDPGGQIKVSETVTVAARVRDTYYDGQTDFTAGEGVLWYRPYVDYALEHGIIAAAPDSWDRPATRAEFAAMLAAALPEKELEAIHGDIAFTDLEEGHPAYAAVMVLARAGVMQGKGEGRFDPDAPVKRSEAAAMLSRCVLPGQRIQPDDPDQPEPPQEELPVRETPLAAGYQDYYAIRKDGSLVMWGRPEFGPIEEDIPYGQALKLLDNAAGVYTSGRGETLAVDRDGALWSINSTRFSSLVPGLEPDTQNPMAPVKVMDGVSMAAMTQFHSVILKRDGSVWVQGFGGFGAPWLMETQPYISKVMDGAVEVGVTAWGGWAITTDHELWAWGVDAGDSAQPKKLLDGVLGVCDLVTVLAANGNGLVRWHDGYSACGVMLSGADRCGRGYAIREDGSLWIDSVGWNGLLYEGPTPFCHVMERVAYAAQGETAMLVLDQDGGLWLLTLEEDSGKVVQTPLQAD